MVKVLPALLAWLVVVASVNLGSQPDAGLLEQEYRMKLIKEIKAYEKELGFIETENFKSYSPETEAYEYYFYTSRTELPHSLDDPLLKRGTGAPEDVPFDLEKYDIFFYSIQSIAEVETPVTRSLMEAPLPRFIHIIFHEDWHEQVELPLGIEEPSAEVVSYSAAMIFAKEKFGHDSEVYLTLRQKFNNKLGESEVYKDYYQQLSSLYSSFHGGTVFEVETLRRKDQLLESMGQELQQLWGARPDQLNNAFIAFQMTYYRYLPLMYRVLSDTDFNLTETISIFRSMPEQGTDFDSLEEIENIEKEVSKYLHESLQRISQPNLDTYLYDNKKQPSSREKLVFLQL